MLISPTPPVTVNMLYIDALIRAIQDDDAIVALARKYHNGIQDTYMNDRVKEFLDVHPNRTFCLNICRTIVLAVKDELSVSGFNTTEKADAEGVKKQSQWAWDLWTRCHMDTVQSEVHESALSDRETFIIVDWDYKKTRPRFVHNYRFTSLEDDEFTGGQGCWMIYENDDVNQPAKCAVKEWIQTDYDATSTAVVHIRRTIYYPDHIEKWVSASGGSDWEHYVEPSTIADADGNIVPEPWPIPWVDKLKQPLGIPVIHFRNVGMMPEAWDAISIQDAINKTLVDILASNDLTAFQMFAAMGWYPTTDGEPPKADGSNLLKVGPGQFIGTRDPNGKFQVISGDDPTPLVAALQDLIVMAAQVTGTPTSRFTTTKLVASAETLKTQDMQLKKKAQDRRVLFGDSWEACMEMARKLTNFFGTDPQLDETVLFTTIWTNNQTLDDLKAKKDLGVPEEILWSEAGYSTDQIAKMKATDEYKATMAGWQSSMYLAQHPELRNPPTTPGDGGGNTDTTGGGNGKNAATKPTTGKQPVTPGEKPKGT